MISGKPTNFIIFGRSGAGKGTQSELLVKHFGNTIHVVTGDLLRDLAQRDTDSGKKIKKVLEAGGLPFDQIATTLWMHKLAFTLKEDQGVVCDGFPRRLREAQDLFEFLTWLERMDNTKVLLINISREESLKRLLKRGRGDDSAGAISSRLDWYEEKVVPAIDYFKSKGPVIEINGEQSIEGVFEEMLQKINAEH